VPPEPVSSAGPEPAEASIAERIHRRLVGRDPTLAADHHRVAAEVRNEAPLLPLRTVHDIVGEVTDRASGLGPLERLLADPAVSEVMVNGPGPVWIERSGQLERTEVVLDRPTVDLLVERVVAPLGLRVDRTAPLADARLPDGSRVNVVVPPLAVDGTCITIRRFGARAFTLDELCPPGVPELLSWAVRAKYNIVVSGGTGSGKTTLLNALGGALPPGERIVTVEDAAELRLPGDHVVRLEARPATAEGLGAVTIRDLVRNALRMRPDRILVGEVRGAEALDMVQAMNTGHEGSLSTCHANSPTDALRRLEVMVLQGAVQLPLAAVRDQIHAAVDLVVQVARVGDGHRRVVGVAELAAAEDSRRTRPIADHTGLRALPERPGRSPGAPAPDPGWCR
jgi:pilus assembly protein CpaF